MNTSLIGYPLVKFRRNKRPIDVKLRRYSAGNAETTDTRVHHITDRDSST